MRTGVLPSFIGLVLLALVTGCGSQGSSPTQVQHSSPQHWITSDKSTETADIILDAGYNNMNGNMNFDGYSNGAMTFTVPVGWTVKVTFINDDSMSTHSAMVVPVNERSNANFSASSLAFPGASTPNPNLGSPNGQPQHFSFTAKQSGKYAIVCTIPGHAAMGMWDNLVVSANAASASCATN